MSNPFDWQQQLDDIYRTFPESPDRPVVGITGNYGDQTCKLAEGYYKTVWQCGGIPVILPPLSDATAVINSLDRIDALLLSGGSDYNPLYAGEEPSPKLGGINSERDLPELLITRLAYNRQIPILGICRGIQTLAMALGGHVRQDISDIATVRHSQDAARDVATHSVTVTPGSLLATLYPDRPTLPVNSFHHQAVDSAGDRFRVTATSPDGIIEAIESSEYKAILGVQWHPECLADGKPLFQWLVQAASDYRAACQLHDRIITLDTHCDTPMLFPQGIDFGSRDPRILVDLHKMHEGRQDATIMVAYLPQPHDDKTFADLVSIPVSGPADYANQIFDRIHDIVRQHSAYLAIARTPADLLANKQARRKSIMLGIENGLALEGNPRLVQHFAQRGVVYITLCHNGDNDLCDSARGSHTHHGVSTLGEQVIHEMNRHGVMVDLSHASEQSFYDALACSAHPIVCSHSSCRALCDHPRNLTDDQMRALAARGGVMQVTLYHGFLVRDGEATLMDALAHLDHAVRVMGVDHVGLGTDFDGDGGVRGIADSSELLQFTQRLLQRHYSPADIAKIWGGNFLRVMQQVQSKKTSD